MARKKKPEPYRPWEDPTLVVTPTVVSSQIGLNRDERRHGFYVGGKTEEEAERRRAAFAEAKRAGRNVPFVGRVFAERAAELARRRKARHAARAVVIEKVVTPDLADVAIAQAIERHWAREAALRVFGKRSDG